MDAKEILKELYHKLKCWYNKFDYAEGAEIDIISAEINLIFARIKLVKEGIE